jgi:hypothetical protein
MIMVEIEILCCGSEIQAGIFAHFRWRFATRSHRARKFNLANALFG